MRKGCFVKVIVIITIFTAIIVYVIQNKFDELILNPGKRFLRTFTEEQIKEEFVHIKQSPEKDTLVLIVRDFFSSHLKKEIVTFEEMEKAGESIKKAALDSVITPDELHDLKKIFRSN